MSQLLHAHLGHVRFAGALVLVALAVSGCGGGSGGADTPASPAPSAPPPASGTGLRALATASPTSTAQCGTSAVRIRIGLDANANGTLEDNEVSYTEVVCTPAGGGTAAPTVSVVAEPPGANCPAGGRRVLVGQDASADGSLQPGEVSNSAYVCDGAPGAAGPQGPAGPAGPSGPAGAPGANGANGANGVNSLLAVAAEPAGANCAAGGTRVQSGLDANRNGTLDAAEVTQTAYVCNGAAGATGPAGANGRSSLLLTAAEPAGANCAYGGTRVQNGLDANSNATLEVAEVAQTAYVCNPPPAGLPWVAISSATQAVANTGYIASGASEVALTLPNDPAVGSIVRISGAGTGGWRINQLAGQTIQTLGSLPVDARLVGSWTRRTDALSGNDRVAVSRDGRHVLAAGGSGTLLVSNDFGVTWTAREANRFWDDLSVSGDGRYMLAAGGGQVSGSSDFGATWTQVRPAPGYIRTGMSTDGRRMVAVTNSGASWISTDFGATCFAGGNIGAIGPARVVVSDDGRHILAPDRDQGAAILVSNDGGATYQSRVSLANQSWVGASMTGDGSTMWASSNVFGGDGSLYRSNDFGATWFPVGPAATWRHLNASIDGQRLAAVRSGTLHVSSNGGASWTALSGTGLPFFFIAFACASDCGRMVGIAPNGGGGGIFTSPTTTSTGTAGGLAGTAGAAAELQYLGSSRWSILGYSGSVVTR